MSQVYLSFSHLMGLLRIRERGKVSESFRVSAWTVAMSHGGDVFDSGWISLTFLQITSMRLKIIERTQPQLKLRVWRWSLISRSINLEIHSLEVVSAFGLNFVPERFVLGR